MINRAFVKLALFCALSVCMITARRLEPVVYDIEQTEFAQQLQHAIKMRDDLSATTNKQQPPQASTTPCSSPSSRWLKSIIADVSEEDLTTFFDNHLHVLPFVYKLHVAPRQYDQEYFGLDGEYTQEITSVHNQAQEFWSDSGVRDEIYLLSAHGSDLADRHDKLVPTLELLFRNTYDSDYTVYDHAADIQELITRLPGGYNFPLLTFNAFATDEMDDEEDDSSIIIGDGYFQFQQALGMDSEGPEYAHAHEFSHHLQFLLGVSDTQSGIAQVAKKSELLADAFSAYFLAHDQGGNMVSDEISNVHSVAFSLGDCVKSSAGHHGTPIQRRCATVWGAELADDREDMDKIDLFEFQNRFDTWYETVDDLSDSCQHLHSAAASRSSRILSLQVMTLLIGGLSVLL
mmetsp:Transcript_23018/g.34706  ORF Transcript_23018/g.34706 Transcript_23018/m.34706 type:complete len:403 (+) Transcript_23018:64-1272(+)